MDVTAQGTVFVHHFESWKQSLSRLLDAAGAADLFAGRRRILIKPNLVEALKPPVTTPVDLVAVLIDYIRNVTPDSEIIVGEGSGAKHYGTRRSFDVLGYTDMAREKEVRLTDLNEESLVKLSKAGCDRWPELYLPEIVFDSFLVSLPVLKAHTLASVTLTMKNMMGLAPPCHYEKGGFWKKASFHEKIHEAIFDLNRYRCPDFTLLDATVGLRKAHLHGPTCNPPPRLLIAGCDPVAVDACGAGVLKRNWREIGHIAMADGELGTAHPLNIIDISQTTEKTERPKGKPGREKP